MKEYKLNSSVYESSKKKLLIGELVFPLIAMIIVSLIMYFNVIKKVVESFSAWIGIIFLFIVFLNIVSAFVKAKKKIKLQGQEWDSYRLIIDEQVIIKKQSGMTDVEVKINEVTNIREVVDFGVTIITDDHQKYIFIPASIEGYNEIRELVSRIRDIEVSVGKIRNELHAIRLVFINPYRSNQKTTGNKNKMVIGIVCYVLLFIIILLVFSFYAGR